MKISRGSKVQPSEMVSVAIRPDIRVVEGHMSASDLALLSRWIQLNYDTLLKYWEGDVDTKDAVDGIESSSNNGQIRCVRLFDGQTGSTE